MHDFADFFQIEKELSIASTLSSKAYQDPSFYAEEKSKVFGNTWQLIGRTDQVSQPGDYFTAEISGEPIVVVRTSDHVLKAMSNVCRHRGSLIAQGHGNTKSLQCPYHAWTYHLNGQLAGAPEFEGVSHWKKNSVCLPTFQVETLGPLVFVHLGKSPVPFSDFLGKIPEELEGRGFRLSDYAFLTRTTYTVNCNWKVYVDNYLEGYHIPTVHPALYRELDYKQYRVDTQRFYSSQFAPLRPVPEKEGSSRRYDPAQKLVEPLYYWLYPNCMINIYPDNLHANMVLPLGVDKTLTVFDWFQLPSCQKTLEETIAFSDNVQKEDVAICESVQKGLHSRFYSRGRYSAKRENGVHHFHLLLQEAFQSR